MPTEEHFVRAADGTRIAYRVSGEGPTLVLTNGLTSTDQFWRYLEPRWSRRCRVVRWDLKGHGHSEAACSERGCSIPALADDLSRVMDAAGAERAVLVGFSLGCQVVAEAWRHIPERIDALGFLLGPAGRMFDAALRPAVGPAVRQVFRRAPPAWLPPVFGVAHRVARMPGSVTIGRWLRLYGRANGSDVEGYVEHFGRLDPWTVSRIALGAGEHDAWPLLGSITVPSLVVAGERDVFAPPRQVGVPMHTAIAGARMLHIPGATHLALVEHPEPIGAAVEELVDAVPR